MRSPRPGAYAPPQNKLGLIYRMWLSTNWSRTLQLLVLVVAVVLAIAMVRLTGHALITGAVTGGSAGTIGYIQRKGRGRRQIEQRPPRPTELCSHGGAAQVREAW